MCPEKDSSQTFDASARPLPPWVQTMLSHIGDMEELKRQLQVLNERLTDLREREKQPIEEEALPFGQKGLGNKPNDGNSAN